MSRESILITGANGGIGQALCKKFVDAGWQVFATDKQETALASVDQYFSLDLDRFATDKIFRESSEEALVALLPNELTCLINNAAFQVVMPVNELTASDWQESMNINVTAPFLLVQTLLPLLEVARGCIINVTSIHAKLTKPNFVAYATTKAALEGLTRALAVEVGSRVRVNAIAPAAIATPMLSSGLGDDAGLDSLAKFHPTQTIGSVEEVAEIAVSLAQRNKMFLNGAVIGLDGGIGARLHDPE